MFVALMSLALGDGATPTTELPIRVSTQLSSSAHADELFSDTRLSKRVTIPAKSYYLGELLEEIARQTGVGVTVGKRGDANGERVAVKLQDVTMRDAMVALQSLFSYKKASWSWERADERGNSPSYILLYSRSGRELSRELKDSVQRNAEAYIEQQLNHLGSDAELAAMFEKDGYSYLSDSISLLRTGLNSFKSLFTLTERTEILRGKETRFSADKVPKAAMPLVEKVVGLNSTTPVWIGFKGKKQGDDLTPELFIGFDGMGWSGYGTGSQYGERLRSQLAQDWILPGDSISLDAVEKRIFEKPLKLPAIRGRFREEDRLREIGDAQNVSYMARIPFRPAGTVTFADDAIYGKTVATVLYEQFPGFSHKWRGKILLVSHPAWINPDITVPYDLVKTLRAKALLLGTGENIKPWLFMDLCAVADAGKGMSEAQWQRLSDEFPVLRLHADYAPLFAQIARSEEFTKSVISRRGISASRFVALSGKPEWQERARERLESENIAHIRLYINPKTPETYQIALYDSDEKYIRSEIGELLIKPSELTL